MKISHLSFILTLLSPTLSSPTHPPIRNIYTFPPHIFVENIAVRCTSSLLLISLSVPSLFSVDPKSPSPSASIVHTFPNATGISGVTEISPDVFALVTGVWDQVTTRAALGSLAIWTVDFTSPSPRVRFVTNIPNSTILNGIVRHPSNPSLLLAADSAAGAIWRVDLSTGSNSVAFSDPLLAPISQEVGSNLGVNGLDARGEYLYFTNSARRIFGKIGIDLWGSRVGEVEVISNATMGVAVDAIYDDIALDKRGEGGGGWIASHPSYAIHVDLDGRQRVVNDTRKLLNPTSCAFGRGDKKEERTLYVTNGGEFVGEDFELVNGGVVAVDLGGW